MVLGALGVCLSLAASPAVPPRFVGVQAFTVAWTHSIEKIRWEEDYTVERNDTGQPVLVPGKARILGSGAGMEPPPDAVLRPDGWYEYQPHTAPLHILRMTRSPYTADYDWCVAGHCMPMRAVMPTDGGVTLLQPCDAAAGADRDERPNDAVSSAARASSKNMGEGAQASESPSKNRYHPHG
ncbi:MAG TPA: DUF1850 domain-containing protein [Castellaniella sp.]|nr:DUF1850 domain-containing protein [Castellaniella sp.]